MLSFLHAELKLVWTWPVCQSMRPWWFVITVCSICNYLCQPSAKISGSALLSFSNRLSGAEWAASGPLPPVTVQPLLSSEATGTMLPNAVKKSKDFFLCLQISYLVSSSSSWHCESHEEPFDEFAVTRFFWMICLPVGLSIQLGSALL